MRALRAAYPESLPRLADVTVDPSVLLFTLGVSIVTGLLVGLAPLAHTRVTALAASLTESGTRTTAGGARQRVGEGLVVAEVALAVMLVLGAGLLVRTVHNLMQVDAGFDRSRLATFSITAPCRVLPTPRAARCTNGSWQGCAPYPACDPPAPRPACRWRGSSTARTYSSSTMSDRR